MLQRPNKTFSLAMVTPFLKLLHLGKTINSWRKWANLVGKIEVTLFLRLLPSAAHMVPSVMTGHHRCVLVTCIHLLTIQITPHTSQPWNYSIPSNIYVDRNLTEFLRLKIHQSPCRPLSE